MKKIKHKLKILFFVWLIAELLAFYAVAKMIGILYTIVLLLLLMIGGMILLRKAGFDRFKTMQEKLNTGQPLDPAKMPNVTKIFSGLLLVIPGFISSLIGLALLIPNVSRGLFNWFIRWATRRPSTKTAEKNTSTGRVIDSDVIENKRHDDKDQ